MFSFINIHAKCQWTEFTNQKSTEWLGELKCKTQLYAASRRLTLALQTSRLKVKGWKMMLQANGSHQKQEEPNLTSEKTDFKPKKVTRDKDGHYIMIKGTIYQEDVVRIIHIYAFNIDALNQKDWIDLYRTFYPNGEYTFISSVHVFSRTDHMLGHKANVNKFKNGIISSIFSEHKKCEIRINYKKEAEKIYKYVKAKQILQGKN